MLLNETKPNASAAEVFHYALYAIVLPTVAVLGVIGNAASLVILFRRKSMGRTISICLAALTLMDTLLLACSLIIYPTLGSCSLNIGIATPNCQLLYRLVQFSYPCSLATQSGSVWCCVLIAMERYVAVRYPLKARHICTAQKAVVFVTLIVMVTSIYNIPVFFELQFNATVGHVVPTNLRVDPHYKALYKASTYVLVVVLVPFCALAVLNIQIVQAVQRAVKLRQSIAHCCFPYTVQTTTTAVAITLCFLCANSPSAAANFIEVSFPGANESLAFKILVYLGNSLIILNSATNVIVYCAAGTKFRKAFIDTFVPCRPRKVSRPNRTVTKLLAVTKRPELLIEPEPVEELPDRQYGESSALGMFVETMRSSQRSVARTGVNLQSPPINSSRPLLMETQCSFTR